MQRSFSHNRDLGDDDEPAIVEELFHVIRGMDRQSMTASPTTSRFSWLSRNPRRPYPTPGYVEVFGNLPMSSAVMTNGYPRGVQIRQLSSFQLPVYLIQSLITVDNSALAKVFTDFRDASRELLLTGEQATEPNFTAVDLFFRDRVPSDPHTASSWASELCKTFGEFPVSVQLASLYLLTYLMRVRVN